MSHALTSLGRLSLGKHQVKQFEQYLNKWPADRHWPGGVMCSRISCHRTGSCGRAWRTERDTCECGWSRQTEWCRCCRHDDRRGWYAPCSLESCGRPCWKAESMDSNKRQNYEEGGSQNTCSGENQMSKKSTEFAQIGIKPMAFRLAFRSARCS